MYLTQRGQQFMVPRDPKITWPRPFMESLTVATHFFPTKCPPLTHEFRAVITYPKYVSKNFPQGQLKPSLFLETSSKQNTNGTYKCQYRKNKPVHKSGKIQHSFLSPAGYPTQVGNKLGLLQEGNKKPETGRKLPRLYTHRSDLPYWMKLVRSLLQPLSAGTARATLKNCEGRILKMGLESCLGQAGRLTKTARLLAGWVKTHY